MRLLACQLISIMVARTDTQCSLVLERRMGNLSSSGIVDAGESCSCSHSDGTNSSWIFAVGEGWSMTTFLQLISLFHLGWIFKTGEEQGSFEQRGFDWENLIMNMINFSFFELTNCLTQLSYWLLRFLALGPGSWKQTGFNTYTEELGHNLIE